MSTRSTTHFVWTASNGEEQTDAIIYRHSDGYPSGAGADLLRFFEEVEASTDDHRYSDGSYLAAKYVVFLARQFAASYEMKDGAFERTSHADTKPYDFLSVGVVMEDPGDIEYRYFVDCSKLDDKSRPTVTVQEVGWGGDSDGERVPVQDAIEAEAAARA